MTLESIKELYKDKADTPCPLTEKLVKAGYQQKEDKEGYITIAKRAGIEVDYTKNLPTQYWHLMSYCYNRNPQQKFTRSIVCGELIFWMAEVSGCVPTAELEQLVDRIIQDPVGMDGERPVYDRRKWNKEIRRVCFDRIMYSNSF